MTDYQANLPSTICFAKDEITEVIPQGKSYLGAEIHFVGNATVEFKMVVTRDVDFEDFARWWNEEVNRGSDWFYAQLLFFGIIDVFKCRFVSDLIGQVTDGIHWGYVKLEIDDIDFDLLDPTVEYVLICDDIISCDAVLECL